MLQDALIEHLHGSGDNHPAKTSIVTLNEKSKCD